MSDLALDSQRVMIRLDLNVPLKNGKVTSDARILATLPTIRAALEQNAAVILLSHLGRPVEGEYDEQFSVQPIADYLSGLLNQSVRVDTDWLDGVDVSPGQVVLCENVRFNIGEKKNDEDLSRRMANLCDVFVMDARNILVANPIPFTGGHASFHQGLNHFQYLGCETPRNPHLLQFIRRLDCCCHF